MAVFYIPKGTTDGTATIGAVSAGDTIIANEGGQTVSAGLALAAALNKLSTGPSFGGSIGSGTAGGISGSVNNGTNPKAVFEGGTIFSALTATRMIVPPMGAGVRVNLLSGTVSALEQHAGRVSCNGTAVVTNFYSAGGDASFLYIAGTSGFQTLMCSGGNVTTGRGLDLDNTTSQLILNSGMVTVRKEDSSGSNLPSAVGTGGAVGLLKVIVNGGILVWSGAGIDQLEIYGDGQVIMDDVPAAMTVSKLTADYRALRRSRLRSKNAAITLPSTIGTDLFIRGGPTDDVVA